MWVWYDASGERQTTADYRFLSGQKAAEKPAPSSEAGGTAQGACGPLKKPRGSNVVRPEIASFLLWNPFGRGFWPRRRKARPRPPIFVRRPAPASRRLMTGLLLFPSGRKSSRAATLGKAPCYRERLRPGRLSLGPPPSSPCPVTAVKNVPRGTFTGRGQTPHKHKPAARFSQGIFVASLLD